MKKSTMYHTSGHAAMKIEKTQSNFSEGDAVIIKSEDGIYQKGIIIVNDWTHKLPYFVETEDGHGAWFGESELSPQ